MSKRLKSPSQHQNPGQWRNCIVGYGEDSPESMLGNPQNWRIHTKPQQDALSGVLSEVGIVQNIIVNKRSSEAWGRDQGVETLVDGHLRVALALSSHQPSIPITYVDLTPAEEAEVLATIDPLSAMAATDKQKLDELLRDVASGEAAVQEMLAELAKANGLDYGKPEAAEDPGPQLDRAEELRAKWKCHAGQIWELGKHRLAIGDCTDMAVVDALMQGELAEMVWTDPPYGVDYEGGRNPVSNRPRKKLAGDTSGALYGPCMAATIPFCRPSAPWYIWFADRAGKPVYDAVAVAGLTVRAMIVWNKINAHYGNFMAQYMQKHEPCIYCVKEPPPWLGPTNEVTVWDVKQPTKNENHPTEKPVELAERAIRNSSREGAIVADWFGGSGTCLIGCERLGRVCRMVELSPAYAAVTIQRWADLTSREPVCVPGVQPEEVGAVPTVALQGTTNA